MRTSEEQLNITVIVSGPGFDDSRTFRFSEDEAMKDFGSGVIAKAKDLYSGRGRSRTVGRSESVGIGQTTQEGVSESRQEGISRSWNETTSISS